MMNRYNNDMLIENDDHGVVCTPVEPQVSAFLNQPSLVKTNMKRSFTDLIGKDNDVLAFDINDVDNFNKYNVGYIDRSNDSEERSSDSEDEVDRNQSNAAGKVVKKEKIRKAKKQSSKGPTRVSKSKREPKRC